MLSYKKYLRQLPCPLRLCCLKKKKCNCLLQKLLLLVFPERIFFVFVSLQYGEPKNLLAALIAQNVSSALQNRFGARIKSNFHSYDVSSKF